MKRKMKFIFFPLMGIAFLGLVSLVVMLLWNYTLPAIFHLPVITFWQALGIFLLSKLLFGFGGGHGGPPWAKRKRFKAYGKFNEEEKEEFKAYMERYRCWGGMPSRNEKTREENKQDDKDI